MKRVHPLLENLKLFKTWTFQNQHKGISLVTLLHFCFRIIVLKMLIFEVYLPIKKSLVTTLTETKSLKNSNYFGRTTSFRYRIVASKILIFEVYLPLKEPFVVSFSETLPHTSRKYVVVQGMILPKLSKKRKLLWLHSSVFALE